MEEYRMQIVWFKIDKVTVAWRKYQELHKLYSSFHVVRLTKSMTGEASSMYGGEEKFL
jgi:hypothetical protein